MSSDYVTVSLIVGVTFTERDLFDVVRQHAECSRGHGQPMTHKRCSDCGATVSVKDVLRVKPEWRAFVTPDEVHTTGLWQHTHDGCHEALSGLPFARIAGLRAVKLSSTEHYMPVPFWYGACVCVGVGHDDGDREAHGVLSSGVDFHVVGAAAMHVEGALLPTPFKDRPARLFPYLYAWRPDFPPGV